MLRFMPLAGSYPPIYRGIKGNRQGKEWQRQPEPGWHVPSAALYSLDPQAPEQELCTATTDYVRQAPRHQVGPMRGCPRVGGVPDGRQPVAVHDVVVGCHDLHQPLQAAVAVRSCMCIRASGRVMVGQQPVVPLRGMG